jgi:drug/metabolite transporter (DMT)-like permease
MFFEQHSTSRISRPGKLNSILGGIVLLLAIIGGGSIGPLSNFIPAKNPNVRQAWRAGLAVNFFLIPAIIELYNKRNLPGTQKIFKFKNQFRIALCALCNCLWGMGLFFAAQYTVQSHTYVLHNT